ncbi:FMN reductase [Gracilibacillus halotolerans]|uniref:FMN reductase n=1 Tax=Gracilibacillus halotolerans TaxID=74386 RepID=A0A841RM76_9BACI|nr:NADPH-dependent FMN reductase [Gracilibacillus halotolerans]MBB6512987.1 FMN reductase [Gracilibacillus halotolerans]
MKFTVLVGSQMGSKTKIAMTKTLDLLTDKYPEIDTTLLDLADYKLPFSDGRNYLDYDGDAKYVTTTIMESDAIIIGTPIYQASIPAPLKNIFDMLPVHALEGKVASIVVTAGSARHYLIAEQQLKPILSYMKAQLVPNYVFVEEMDFKFKEIENDDVVFRLERLIEDTVLLAEVYKQMVDARNAEYDF